MVIRPNDIQYLLFVGCFVGGNLSIPLNARAHGNQYRCSLLFIQSARLHRVARAKSNRTPQLGSQPSKANDCVIKGHIQGGKLTYSTVYYHSILTVRLVGGELTTMALWFSAHGQRTWRIRPRAALCEYND